MASSCICLLPFQSNIPAPIPYNPFLTFSTVTEKVPFVAKSTKISYSLFSFGLIISIPLWAFNFQPFYSELFSDVMNHAHSA
jgi:hypothetical protein